MSKLCCAKVGSFLKPSVIVSKVSLKTTPVVTPVQVNSILEIKHFSLLMMIIGKEEILRHGTKEVQRMASCGRVVGVDEPIQMGSSTQKSLRRVLLLFFSIHFHHIFVIFPTQEIEHGWYIFVLNCSN